MLKDGSVVKDVDGKYEIINAAEKRADRLKEEYDSAQQRLISCDTESEYLTLSKVFASFGDYEDSVSKVSMCKQLAAQKKEIAVKEEKAENERISKFNDLKNEYFKKYPLTHLSSDIEKRIKDIDSKLPKIIKSKRMHHCIGIVSGLILTALIIAVIYDGYIDTFAAFFCFLILLPVVIASKKVFNRRKTIKALKNEKQTLSEELCYNRSTPSLKEYVKERNPDLCYLVGRY